MPTFRTLALAFALLGLPAVAAAEAVRHELDPVHTRVMFAVSHAGFSNAIGTVSGSTGELWFDPEDWSSARLQATVPLARLDLGDAKWNKAALANNLLDVDDHPQATFAVFGTLTLHGVAREVKFDITLNAAKRHPMPPFRRTVGFSATATLSRKAFGIDAWPSVIGDAVELRIEAEAVRARGDADAAPSDVEAANDAADDRPAAMPPLVDPANPAPVENESDEVESEPRPETTP